MQAANAAALAAGLRVGMPATKAQALVPGLLLQEADLAADTLELERLAIWLHQRVAPIVAPDPPMASSSTRPVPTISMAVRPTC